MFGGTVVRKHRSSGSSFCRYKTEPVRINLIVKEELQSAVNSNSSIIANNLK
jgi:hypothetical protein